MHYTEDDLVLYYYGESSRRAAIDEHLVTCGTCSTAYQEIVSTLALVGHPEVPERDERYGLEVWQRIRHKLPVQEPPFWMAWLKPALAAAVVLAIATAFVSGRFWPAQQIPAPQTAAGDDLAAAARERVLSAAIGDHLEQSGRVLLDFVNTGGDKVDVSDQQLTVADLVDTNRLYRHAAERAGDETVASVLDELERTLLEIANGPSTLTPAELEAVRARLDAAALLFRVRVLSDELHEREIAPAQPRKTT
jgi:hypothetical protein